jgi:sulfur-oxidizing protein SoxY
MAFHTRPSTAPRTHHLSRRVVLGGAAAAIATSVPLWPAYAAYDDDGDGPAAIKNIAAGRAIKPGRVKLTLPELAENGNVVSMLVEVESPMTATDYVKTIHIVADKNPLANIARFHLSPRSGRARVQSNIRLATTQTVTALAELSDGTLWSGTSTVLVTLSACLDGG